MQSLPFIILIIIILIVAGFSNSFRALGPTGVFDKNAPKENISKVNIPSSGKVMAPASKQGFYIDTFITSGPKNGETILNEKNQITFEFKGTVQPANIPGGIYFETKVEGLDNNWTEIYSTKKTIDFPAGNQEYTFLARARSKDFIDETPAKRTFKFKASPYFNKVKIGYVSPTSITLTSNLSDKERVDLVNWKLSGKKGRITIDQGVELYLPGRSSKKNISLEKYGSVVFSDGQSPLGSEYRNFRPNKCFSYLPNSSDFKFSFSSGKICPKITYDDVSRLNKMCQDYVRGLQNCNALDYSSNPISYDSNCVAFINNYTSKNLNYTGCVENYYNDKDFLNNPWYVYSGYNIFCDCNDFLYLYDADGFIVDKYYQKASF